MRIVCVERFLDCNLSSDRGGQGGDLCYEETDWFGVDYGNLAK